MRPTLSDVAKLAGVSVATASRALSNPDLVADGTRRAVREAAASCGYKINLVARSLRIQRTDTLLVLAPSIEDAFYPAILRSIEDTALSLGYAVIIGFTAKDDRHREAYANLLSNGRVDGMLVMDGGTRVDRFTGPRPDAPVVQILDQIYNAPVPIVRVDEYLVADLAVRHLAGLGHRRIGHIGGLAGCVSAAERQQGFMAAVAKLGLPLEDRWIVSGQDSREGAAAAMTQLLDLPQRPTAVFCASDAMASAALEACRARGLHVPADISIIGTGDTADSQHAFPGLTSVHLPRAEIGQRATEKLVSLIRGQSGLALDTVLPVELRQRGSSDLERTAAAA